MLQTGRVQAAEAGAHGQATRVQSPGAVLEELKHKPDTNIGARAVLHSMDSHSWDVDTLEEALSALGLLDKVLEVIGGWLSGPFDRLLANSKSLGHRQRGLAPTAYALRGGTQEQHAWQSAAQV